MSYSFDKTNDRWSELADDYQSMLDELASEDMEDVFIPVAHFDPDEVL
jgi:predicted Zn-dependent protease with MMP-like domain